MTELAFTRELSAKLTDEAKCQREVNRRRWWLFFSFFSPFIILSAAAVCFERDDDQRCVCVCTCACVHGADSSRSMMKRKRTRAHSSLYFMLRSVCSCCCFVSLCVCGLQQYRAKSVRRWPKSNTQETSKALLDNASKRHPISRIPILWWSQETSSSLNEEIRNGRNQVIPEDEWGLCTASTWKENFCPTDSKARFRVPCPVSMEKSRNPIQHSPATTISLLSLYRCFYIRTSREIVGKVGKDLGYKQKYKYFR